MGKSTGVSGVWIKFLSEDRVWKYSPYISNPPPSAHFHLIIHSLGFFLPYAARLHCIKIRKDWPENLSELRDSFKNDLSLTLGGIAHPMDIHSNIHVEEW